MSIDSHRPSLSIVIPTYNGERVLEALHAAIVKNVKPLQCEFEIIFVDDSSTDGSWEKIVELTRTDPYSRGLQLAGIDHAHYECVVVMACDFQDDPQGIPQLYERLVEGYDVVYAVRVKLQYDLRRRIYSRMFYFLLNLLSDEPFDREASNYVLMSRMAVDYYRQHRERLRTFRGILTKMSLKGARVEVPHRPRLEGRSSYSFARALRLALNHLLAYSDKPFEYVLFAGFAVAFLSFAYGGSILIHALIVDSSVPGWSSLIVSMFFLGGTIIAITGFLGIYLKKCFEESMQRPLYHIRHEISKKTS
jgi:glycosyltransferase involved in cell wall biosynthesis